MNRLSANDLRDLIKEVVSAYWEEKHNWLLESPEVLEEGVFDPGILKAIFPAGGPGRDMFRLCARTRASRIRRYAAPRR